MSLNNYWENYFDPKQLNDQLLPMWHGVWIGKNISDKLLNLLKRLIYLPDTFDFYPLIASYMMTPTRACKCLPIVVLTGKAGTGKSTLMSLIKELRDSHIHTSACTFSSLRNSINNQRYFDVDQPKYEKEGTILLWDNLRVSHLSIDPNLYQLLLLGYNFRTSNMSVAKNGGKNINFNTFCPKVLSTIDDFHTIPEFSELYRRLWVIPHKRPENLLLLDLKIDQINWSGFSSVYFDFWHKDNYLIFLKCRQALDSQKYREKLPIEIFELCLDVLAVGLTLGIFNDTDNAIDYIIKYYQWFKNDVLEKASNLEKLIKIYLENETSENITSINPKLLKNYINECSNKGLIDTVIRHSQIVETMAALGYKLTIKGYIQNE